MFKFLSEVLIVVVVEEVTGGDNPLVLVGYDSRVDKFQKVKKMFPHIYPGGTTPEGLCFETFF